MQNDMTMAIHKPPSKSELARILIWRRLYLETGSSNISDVNWDISSKFVMQIDFYLHEYRQ